MKGLFAVLAALPEILKLVKTLQDHWKKAETERKFKDDVARINKAFEEKNAKSLNAVLSGQPDPMPDKAEGN